MQLSVSKSLMRWAKAFLIPPVLRGIVLFSPKKLRLSTTRTNAIFFLTPNYGNSGDLAIRLSQKWFVEKVVEGANVVTVPVAQSFWILRSIRKQLGPSDVVALVGGGSLGEAYPRADFERVEILRFLRNYPIVSFPQSHWFGTDRYGQFRLRQNAKAINRHRAFSLFARDKMSQERMSADFRVPATLVPDIVLSLFDDFKFDSNVLRRGVTASLRSDAELARDATRDPDILGYLCTEFGEVRGMDTLVGGVFSEDAEAEKQVDSMLDLYSRSELVLTDRLHGMIFAAITRTPCIVVQNKNDKILGCYNDWLSSLPFIRLVDEYSRSEVQSALESIRGSTRCEGLVEPVFDFGPLARAVSHLQTAVV